MLWCKAIAFISALTCFTIWCLPSSWFIIVVCSWRRAVYLLETSVVFGAQWFSSLVQVHLFVIFVDCFVDDVTFLSVILLTYSFISPHQVDVPCSFQFVQVILKVPSCIKSLILDVFLFPRPLDSSLPSWCLWQRYNLLTAAIASLTISILKTRCLLACCKKEHTHHTWDTIFNALFGLLWAIWDW